MRNLRGRELYFTIEEIMAPSLAGLPGSIGNPGESSPSTTPTPSEPITTTTITDCDGETYPVECYEDGCIVSTLEGEKLAALGPTFDENKRLLFSVLLIKDFTEKYSFD